MQIPQNHTEEQVLNTIELVVNSLAPNFTFGYYDVDDLKQEGRISAMDALKLYDSSKGASLRTFLHNHVRNRYINLKRDKYLRPAPKNLSEEELEKWLKKNRVKRSIIDATDIADQQNDYSEYQPDSFVDNIHNAEILRIIDIHLPVEYRADYRCLVEDVKLPKKRRLKIIEILKVIVNEHFRKETGQTE